MAQTLYDEKPKRGDLIEIFRGPYQHWAVYVGEGFIVHLAPPCDVFAASANSMMSVFSEKAMVKKEELWDVVGSSKWKINNGLDEEYKPRDPDVIVREACRLVDNELPYCVFGKNCEHFANELRYGKAESQQKPELGDLIEIFRSIYQHWAVYVGEGFIVHLAPPSGVLAASASSMMSVLATKAVVKKEKLRDVVGSSKWKINNGLDEEYEPRDPSVIVREACRLVDNEQPYSIFRKNCEHFANELRYGRAESRQVPKAEEIIVAIDRINQSKDMGVVMNRSLAKITS